MSRRWWLVLAGIVLVAAAAVAWRPSGTAAHQNAFALSHQIMSPYCPGLTLAACPSGAAEQLRSEVAARVKAGESSTSIVDDLARRFGPAVRGTPAARGWSLLLWIVPACVGILGAAAIVMVGRRRAVSPSAVGDAPPEVSADWASRLDDELTDLD